MRVCQTRRFHSICVHFVLITTAIQGVTPDAHDLASLNALRVFCPPLSSSGAVPQDDGLPDTDDVCGSTTIETEQVFRANADLNCAGHARSCRGRNPRDDNQLEGLPLAYGRRRHDGNR